MPFWVYVIRCADGSYYAGHTDNLQHRFGLHQVGEVAGYTTTRRPLELAFSQVFVTREEALRAELQIKGWTRRKKEALMNADWQAMTMLSKRRPKQKRPTDS